MIPSVSRIVHYMDPQHATACRAAIIAAVPQHGAAKPAITLTVFPPHAPTYAVDATRHDGRETHGDGQPPGMCGDRIYPADTWHWPARTSEGPS